ncbi:MAG: hypothetical protein AAF998_28295 [Bacteroidota bacterium]
MNRFLSRFPLNRLRHPAFWVALGLLILNDGWLKSALHNGFTGKLSDFAGLFAFAVVARVVFFRRPGAAVAVSGLLFIGWKMPLATPLLEAWNGLGILPLHRVLDPTDLWALLVLPLAARLPPPRARSPRPLAEFALLGGALLAFVATSYRAEFDYEAVYEFGMPAEELVRRLNQINREEQLPNLPLSTNHRNANAFDTEEGDRYYYHHNGRALEASDTVVIEYIDRATDEVDSTGYRLEEYVTYARDTHYVSPEGIFEFSFSVPDARGKTLIGKDCAHLPARLRLIADGATCKLELRQVLVRDCEALFNEIGDRSVVEFVQDNFRRGLVERVADF